MCPTCADQSRHLCVAVTSRDGARVTASGRERATTVAALVRAGPTTTTSGCLRGPLLDLAGGRRRGRGAGVVAARDARPGPAAARRRAAAQRAGVRLPDVRGGAGRCLRRRGQPDPPRRGACPRHRPHGCQFVVADATYGRPRRRSRARRGRPVGRLRRCCTARVRSAAVHADVPAVDLGFDVGAEGRDVQSGPVGARRVDWASARRHVFYCPMPLSHGNALSAALFPALASGADCCCATASRRRPGSTTSGRTT